MVTDELQINITADTGNAATNIQNTANALGELGDSAKTADGDMSELVRIMSEAAASMVSISQNIASSAAGLSSFQSSVDAVSATLQGVNTNFDALNAHLSASYTAFDSASTSVAGLSAASETTSAALTGIVSSTDGFADRMDALSDTTHGTTVGMVNLQKELVDTLTSLRGFGDSMGTAGKDAEETSRKIKELANDVEKLTKQSASGQTAVLSLASGFKTLKGIIATLGIAKFVKDSNDAYVVQMQNELKLTAHMKQRMNATDNEVQSIKELASAQQRLGVIGDEIQLAGAQQLTTYAKQTSTLKTLLPAMNNLIAQNAGYDATVSSATSAADMLGRALNGQYTSLKRMGVTFTEAQEQVLKYGTEQQKAAVLAQAINDKVGNMNELLANTPTGKLKQLQNEFGDLKEQLGATFQPLISTFVPVAKKALEILAPPVIAFSTGLGVIGQALLKLDSPATRAISLAVAGVYVMNKLKLAVGSTAAGLLLLGGIAVTVLGAFNRQENAIANDVENAWATAGGSTDDATDSVKNYEEEIQKTKSKLAGFDTLTKLSGASMSIDASEYQSEFEDIEDEIENVKESMSEGFLPNIDWKQIGAGIYDFIHNAWNSFFEFGKDLATLVEGWGNDEKMYKPLKKWSNQIEDILNAVGLDGTAFVDFWKGIGEDVYKAMTGDDSAILKGFQEIDDAFKFMLGDFGKEWSNFWKKAGAGLYELTHKDQIDAQAINDKYSAGDFNALVIDALKSGMTADEAVSKAQSDYLTSSEAWYWYDNLLDKNAKATSLKAEFWRNTLIESGEISNNAQPSESRRISPMGIPSNVLDKINITINIDGQEAQNYNKVVTNGA